MPMNLQRRPPSPVEKVKHLYLRAQEGATPGIEYFPYFHVEVRIDFNDVRTGLRETVSLNKALEIYSDNADLLWIDDMVRDVDADKTMPSPPDAVHLGLLPAFVNANFISRMETQFIQYVLRSFAVRLYRNSVLNVYSRSGESRAEFSGRCLELLNGPKREELDLLHEVFDRRLEQLKEKYLGMDESCGLEQTREEVQNKDIFSHYSEQIAELFLKAELLVHPPTASSRYLPQMQELEERLMALELEAQQAVAALGDVYEEKARSLDEYILHPNLKDIRFVRSGILWMPKKAA